MPISCTEKGEKSRVGTEHFCSFTRPHTGSTKLAFRIDHQPYPKSRILFPSKASKADLDSPKCFCQSCRPDTYAQLRHSSILTQGIINPQLGYFPGRALKFRSHESSDLAATVVRSIESVADRTFGQRKALSDWKEWRQSPSAETLRTLEPGRLNARVLQRPAEIFNQLFFLGQLPPHRLSIEWGPPPHNPQTLGKTFDVESEADPVRIILNPYSPYHKLSVMRIMCTLLHEMIHAFFIHYSCRGGPSSTCKSPLCAKLAVRNLGTTGHGRAWQSVAQCIEEALATMLGFKGRLGRQECAVREIESFGFRPSECDIGKLYSKFSVWVRTNMRRWYDDDEVLSEIISSRMRGTKWLRRIAGQERRFSV